MSSLEEHISEAFIAACRDELDALKPGNVHVFAGGHGMSVDHFYASAMAASPALSATGLSTGHRILKSVEASFAATGLNTNLGILLLCAPLAVAMESASCDLRASLSAILLKLDEGDASDAFRAIAKASPGGLGDAPRHDVHGEACVTLLMAMAEAAARDRIAYQYVSDFEDIFVTGFEAIAAAKARGTEAPWIAVALFLTFLTKFPDTHICRKFGLETAERVQSEASEILNRFRSFVQPKDAFDELLAFDTRLKSQGLNPGTSADLTVATLFADRLSCILLPPRING
jgi:triphosphoribosyl-dephospho-CoA synthase